MKKLILILTIILCAVSAFAQDSRPIRPRLVSTKPVGTCSERDFIQALDTHKTSLCQNGAWADIVTGAGATPGGSSGQLQINSAGVFAGITLGGDCTFASPNVTCTKTGGVSFAAVATSGAKADVGLGNVDNTSDANKPLSTAQQTALNLKANLASPTFTGTVGAPTINATTNFQFNGTATSVRFPSKVTTQFDKTNTTLADVTGLSVTVTAGRTYQGVARLYVSGSAVGGGKYAVGGTATATNFRQEVVVLSNDTQAITSSGATGTLGTAHDPAAGPTSMFVQVTFTITVNAGGTLTIQFAQHAASGTSSVVVGSTLIIEDLN